MPAIKPPTTRVIAAPSSIPRVTIVETAGTSAVCEVWAIRKNAGVMIMHKCTSVRHALSAGRNGSDAISIGGFECAGIRIRRKTIFPVSVSDEVVSRARPDAQFSDVAEPVGGAKGRKTLRTGSLNEGIFWGPNGSGPDARHLPSTVQEPMDRIIQEAESIAGWLNAMLDQ